jgi:hypothetical protein
MGPADPSEGDFRAGCSSYFTALARETIAWHKTTARRVWTGRVQEIYAKSPTTFS